MMTLYSRKFSPFPPQHYTQTYKFTLLETVSMKHFFSPPAQAYCVFATYNFVRLFDPTSTAMLYSKLVYK